MNCQVPIAGAIDTRDREPANGPTYPNSVLSWTCAIEGWTNVADGPPLLMSLSSTKAWVVSALNRVCNASVASLMFTACRPTSIRLKRLKGYDDSMNPSRMTKRRIRDVYTRRLSAVP